MLDGLLRLVAVLGAGWLVLLVALYLLRPKDLRWPEVKGVAADLVALVRGLARDAEVPRRVRWWLRALVAYLALPFDLVPDFVPVIGMADDVIVIALVLRSVVRASGADAVERHWRGGPAGLRLVLRLAGKVA